MKITGIATTPNVATPVAAAAPSAPEAIYIAQLPQQADLSQELQLPRGADRRVAVWNDLVATAQQTQPAAAQVLDGLKAEGVLSEYIPVTLSNSFVLKAPTNKMAALEQALTKAGIFKSVEKDLDPTSIAGAGVKAAVEGAARVQDTPAPDASKLEWNVAKIGADQLWKEGVTGQGVTVGVIDTGLDATHPAIAGAYKGTGAKDHSYTWYDPINGKTAPYDDGQHGTHVSGTIAGLTPDGRQLGVAPGAKIIAAKALGEGLTPNYYALLAMQWMLAPTDVNGKNADPRQGADIISNSWGDNLHATDESFRTAVQQMSDAGIVPIFAAGNDARENIPVSAPGSFAASITVGATDRNDKIASFSSRGPSRDLGPDGKPLIKPDVSAPGVAITSAIPGGGYATWNGTSMATPAVAGAAALLLSKYPELDPEQVRTVLEQSAIDLGKPGKDIEFGSGRIDVPAAMEGAAKLFASQRAAA